MASTGVKAFSHNNAVKTGKVAAGIHDRLNPNGVIRESRDSDEHPTSNPIAIWFDVTASMGHIPVTLQENLPKFMSALLRKSCVDHPQVLFGAVGDEFSDSAPIQVGQFESNIEMDEDVDKIWIESGGGGGNHESYGLAMYFMAECTKIDSFEKRGKKGYLFMVGDERAHMSITREAVRKYLGQEIQSNIPFEEVVEMVQEKYELFFIVATESPMYGDENVAWWKEKLGENVISLTDANLICEVIVSQIASWEGISFDEMAEELNLVGVNKGVVKNALVPVSGKGALVAGTVAGDLVVSDGDGIEGV